MLDRMDALAFYAPAIYIYFTIIYSQNYYEIIDFIL